MSEQPGPPAPPAPPAAYSAHAAYGAPPAQTPYGAPAGGGQPPYGAPPQPGYPAQAYTPPAAKPSPVLSIISLVAGILGVLGAGVVFIPFVGGVLQLFIPAAAVVLGYLGKKKEPAARGLWLTGIILGFVGIGIAVLSFILWGIVFATADSSYFYGY